MNWELEQAATAILDETDQGGNAVSIELVARRLDLRIVDGGPGCDGLLFGRDIIVDETLPKPRWNFVVAHEIGHFDAQRSGRSDTEWAANYIASALLMPRDAAESAFRRTGRDLFRLMSIFRQASGEAIARRLVALREVRVFVHDRPDGGRPRGYSVPWRVRPAPVELEAVDEAFRSGAPVEPYAGIAAWPLFQEGWRRVIAVSDAESVRCAVS